MNNCVFCTKIRPEEIVCQNEHAFSIRPIEKGVVLPGAWLIIPRVHCEGFDALPPDWWRWQEDLRKQIPEISGGDDFNLYSNQGEYAGQSVAHVHFWLIVRSADEPEVTRGYSLYTLIRRLWARAQSYGEVPDQDW